MKFYAIYLGDGLYIDMRNPGYSTCELCLDALTVDHGYAKEIYRRKRNHKNRYNPEGWPDLKVITYVLTPIAKEYGV